ncbi:MAG: alpha/beta hydrolase [Chitinophaga sp.]|uniref:alpha/beta fold hydrolase n=1 Tax=Chitinophaga sp. TaxID=1869181 RepID=UPI001B13FF48|nr:alpha/beta hydrolase [Chitinophaga sp.]MBO9729390.1 alpha/beta hydrolase [Chitinophaga sp.]
MKKFILLGVMQFLGWYSMYAQSVQQGEFEFKTSDSVKLYVKVAGKGPVCIFIHGGPGQGSRSFEEMKGKELEACFTMVYLDQRGSGKSQNATNYHLSRVIQDIEELRRYLKADKPFLLAHSFGGMLAFNYALAHPANVRALMLVSVTLNMLSKTALTEALQYKKELLGEDTSVSATLSRDTLWQLNVEKMTALRKRGLAYKLLSEDTATIQKQMAIDDYKRSQDFAIAVLFKQEQYPEYTKDYIPFTQQLKIPVLIIAGTADHAVGIKGYKTFAFPKKTVSIIEGGHLLYYENNTAFKATVCDFAQQH